MCNIIKQPCPPWVGVFVLQRIINYNEPTTEANYVGLGLYEVMPQNTDRAILCEESLIRGS